LLFEGKSDKKPYIDVNFSSECFFLTLHCHHLAVIPIMRKYQRRVRAIRDLNRMIEEMEGNHPQWKSQVQVRLA
jgi:ubiquitin conjugation factor E4 B